MSISMEGHSRETLELRGGLLVTRAAEFTWPLTSSLQLLYAKLFYFFVVILPVEDVPLLTALLNDPPLRRNLLLGRCIDPHLFHEQLLQCLARLLANCIAVLEEVALLGFGEGIGDDMGQLV